MKLPNFVCVGAQKAGTTTLHDILTQHPDIFLPQIKETKFFQDNSKYQKGLDFYLNEYFKEYNGEKKVGEIDPEYMFFEYVAERLYKDLGKNIKIIFMLRNPVDRAYSHYWMSVRRGYENLTFEEAIKLEKERTSKNEDYKKYFSYIQRGLYAKQIKNFLTYFPKENMFFIIFEKDFLKNRNETIISLLKFLDVEPTENINVNIKSNPASMPKLKIVRDLLYKKNPVKKFGKILIPSKTLRASLRKKLEHFNNKKFTPPKLDNSLKSYMIEKYFFDDIKELEKILDLDLSIWYR